METFTTQTSSSGFSCSKASWVAAVWSIVVGVEKRITRSKARAPTSDRIGPCCSSSPISPTEYEMTDKTYFPQPGDSKEVMAQKRQARANIIKQLHEESKQTGRQPTSGGPTSQAPAGGKVVTRAALHADPPHVLLREMNWLLGDDRTPCTATGCAIVINPKTGAAEYATAGSVGAVVVDDCGEPRQLTEAGIPDLGSLRNYAYASKPLRIQAEETLVLYTPGAFAVRNEEGQALGQGRLTEALCDGFGIPASDALNNLLADLSGHFKQGRQPDDITFVFMHRTEA